MNFYKLCDYFEDIGIINLNTINIFLEIYTQLNKNSKAIFPNNLIRAKYALYNFIKHLAQNKALLLDYSSQTIEKYNTHNTLKQQSAINKLSLILRNRLKVPMIASFYKIKHRFFNQKTSKLPSSKYFNADIIECTFNPKITPHQSQKQFNNPSHNTPAQHHKNNSQSHKPLSPSSSRNKHHIKQQQSAVTASLKSINSRNEHLSRESLTQFHLNQEKHLNEHKEKITALRLKEMNKIDSQCTFQPNLPKTKRIKRSHTIDTFNHRQPRYIKLNKDAVENQKKIRLLRSRLEAEEEINNRPYSQSKSNSNSYLNNTYLIDVPSEIYYEKLYQDAYELQLRKNEIEKKYYSDLSFQPNNLNNNTSIEIKSTFEERNNKLLEARRKHQAMKEKELKKKREGLSKNQIEENNKNVIDRLYVKHFDKKNSLNNKQSSRGPTELTTFDQGSNRLKSQENTMKGSLKSHNSKLTDRNNKNHTSSGLIQEGNDQTIHSHPSSNNTRTVNTLLT